MPRLEFRIKLPKLLRDIWQYFAFLRLYFRKRGYFWFSKFEGLKDVLVDVLYKKRGRYSRPFLHVGTIGLIFAVIIIGPVIFRQEEQNQGQDVQGGVMQASAFGTSFYTLQAEEVRQFRGGEVTTHTVQEGETISQIASRYGLEPTTIYWENDLTDKSTLKPGQQINILPVNGIRHKVSRGETIFSIAKKYGLDESQAQQIVDYPFNEFLNDETFELAIGQFVIVPDGVKPEEVRRTPIRTGTISVTTPDAGPVNASGSFLWPVPGIYRITQGYRFYHKAIDVANKGGGAIVAADSGTVSVAGWTGSGYGNHVIIDHGNGFSTLYAHFSVVQVAPGQRVNKGDLLGQMGCTGRCTGTHLHFEIRQGGVLLNPMSYFSQ